MLVSFSVLSRPLKTASLDNNYINNLFSTLRNRNLWISVQLIKWLWIHDVYNDKLQHVL